MIVVENISIEDFIIYRPNRSVTKPPNRPPIIPPRANIATMKELEKTRFNSNEQIWHFLTRGML